MAIFKNVGPFAQGSGRIAAAGAQPREAALVMVPDKNGRTLGRLQGKTPAFSSSTATQAQEAMAYATQAATFITRSQADQWQDVAGTEKVPARMGGKRTPSWMELFVQVNTFRTMLSLDIAEEPPNMFVSPAPTGIAAIRSDGASPTPNVIVYLPDVEPPQVYGYLAFRWTPPSASPSRAGQTRNLRYPAAVGACILPRIVEEPPDYQISATIIPIVPDNWIGLEIRPLNPEGVPGPPLWLPLEQVRAPS
jgi:hypothetical protein